MDELLKKLIGIKTVNNNETEIAEYLYNYLKKYANKIELIGEGKRKNILAYFGDLTSKNILLFNGHLDTVSAMENNWNSDPFVLTECEGLFYGRGTADMKGGIVASILAIIEAKKENLINNKLIIFAGTADEETGADSELGSKKIINHLIDKNIIPIGAIIPEPNSNEDKLKINLGHRGLIWIQCEAKGTVIHSGLLRKEDNAILNMNQFIERIYNLFPKEPTKINGVPQSSCKLTYMNSGEKEEFRKTPFNCTANLDIRVSPLEKNEDILENIKKIAEELDIKINIIKNTPSSSITKNEKIVQIIEEVLQKQKTNYELGYASPTCDAHWYINNGIPAINGIGATGGNIHAANEYIILESIHNRIKTFKEIIKKF